MILNAVVERVAEHAERREPLPPPSHAAADPPLPPAPAACRTFGWTPKNEISNSRWVMFGWAVGLLTEYATGVDFPHQLALMVSYLGIVDIE